MVPLRYAWHAKTAIAVRFRCLRCDVRVELLELRRIIDQSDQLVPDTAAPCRTVRNMLSHFQTCHAQCHHAEAAHDTTPERHMTPAHDTTPKRHSDITSCA